MTRSLGLRLIAAFLVVSLAGTLLFGFFAGQATASEFGSFMMSQNRDDIVAALAAYYQANGSWAGVEPVLRDSWMGHGGMMGHGTMMGGLGLADEHGDGQA